MLADLTVTLTVTKDGSGTVTQDPEPVLGKYEKGTVVTLTATPAAGWTFGAFSGDVTGGSPATVTMDGDKSVTATFTQNSYTLTVTKVGNGTVAKAPDQATYHYGDVVTLTATADAGWTFAGFTGDATGGSPADGDDRRQQERDGDVHAEQLHADGDEGRQRHGGEGPGPGDLPLR